MLNSAINTIHTRISSILSYDSTLNDNAQPDCTAASEIQHSSPQRFEKNDNQLLEACLDYYNDNKKDCTQINKILDFCSTFTDKRNELINPLFLPILYGDEENLTEMLKAGIEPDWMSPEKSLRDLFSSYSKQYPNLAGINNKFGITLRYGNKDERPLAFALRCKFYSMATILLKHGADAKIILNNAFKNFRQGNRNEFYALVELLRWAINTKNDAPEIILTALDNINFENGIDRFGQFIFLLAKFAEEYFLESILNSIKKIKIERRFNLVFQAIFFCEKDLFNKVLKAGANPNIVDHKRDRSALHYAAEQSDLDKVNSLIAHEAQVDLQTDWDLTALDFAVLRNRSDIIERLLDANANPNLGRSLEKHQLDVIKSMDAELKSRLLTNTFASLGLSNNLSYFLRSRKIKLNYSITEQYAILDKIPRELSALQSKIFLGIPVELDFDSENGSTLGALIDIDTELKDRLLDNTFASLGLSENLARFLESRGIKPNDNIIKQYKDKTLDRIQDELLALQTGNALDIAVKKYDLALEKESLEEQNWEKGKWISAINTLLKHDATLSPGHPIYGDEEHPLFEKLTKKK